MRIFVAGATGAVGRRLVPMLVEAGHEVAGTTRSADRRLRVAELGAQPVVVDVYDAAALRDAMAAFHPDAVIHQLTDLSGADRQANARLRAEGTPNLVEAARAAGVRTMVAQSICWTYAPGEGPATEADPLDVDSPVEARRRMVAGVKALEDAVATMDRGVVLRYGFFYGPGTWYAPDGLLAEQARAGEFRPDAEWASFVHVDDAAAAAVLALAWPSGPVNVTGESATPAEWVPAFRAAVGATGPDPVPDGEPSGRPVSAAKAHGLGWEPRYPSWRDGFARQ